MFSKESKELANKNTHNKEACQKREETKRKNGFYEENVGYQKGLNKRIENGSLEKWKKSGQTSEAHAKQNTTRWNNLSDEEREKEIKRLNFIHDEQFNFTYNIPCNEKCDKINTCSEEKKKNCLKNAYGWCEEKQNSFFSRRNIIIKNGVIFWRGESAEDLVYDLLNNIKDIKDYPELEIRDGHVCYNRIDILTGDKVLLNTNFLQVKDNVVFWKEEPAEPLVNDLLSGKRDIKDYLPLEIRFKKHVCYNRKDILTGELILYKGEDITIHNGVEFVLDHSTGRYVEKDYFYKKHYDRISNIDGNEEINNFIDNEGFSKEPIAKIDEKTLNREQTDFNLVNKGYGWIVYIKLLDNHSWICGKTGTRKVSKSPIDFDFVIGDKSNPNYSGPGREYARLYYPEREFSDFDFILVKGFETEQEAISFEQYIVRKYNLFKS